MKNLLIAGVACCALTALPTVAQQPQNFNYPSFQQHNKRIKVLEATQLNQATAIGNLSVKQQSNTVAITGLDVRLTKVEQKPPTLWRGFMGIGQQDKVQDAQIKELQRIVAGLQRQVTILHAKKADKPPFQLIK